jgi:glycosyltransferase involved in cell wall biosynthesis
MQYWREIWLKFLEASDDIICFSEISKSIFIKIFPEILSKTKVLPHQSILNLFKPITVKKEVEVCHIGVIGSINYAKGLQVLKELVVATKAYSPGSIKISLVGEYSSAEVIEGLFFTGKFIREDLSDIVQENGINCFLFPSIWPETYAYVVDEMIAMELPLVCFNIGAPAERVINYSKGLVVDIDISKEKLIAIIYQHYLKFTPYKHI